MNNSSGIVVAPAQSSGATVYQRLQYSASFRKLGRSDDSGVVGGQQLGNWNIPFMLGVLTVFADQIENFRLQRVRQTSRVFTELFFGERPDGI